MKIVAFETSKTNVMTLLLLQWFNFHKLKSLTATCLLLAQQTDCACSICTPSIMNLKFCGFETDNVDNPSITSQASL